LTGGMLPMSRPAAPTLRERSPVRRLMSSYLAFAFSCRSFWSERTKATPVAKKRHKYGKLALEASVENRRENLKKSLDVRAEIPCFLGFFALHARFALVL